MEQQAIQMQDPNFAAMMMAQQAAGGFMPPFGMADPAAQVSHVYIYSTNVYVVLLWYLCKMSDVFSFTTEIVVSLTFHTTTATNDDDANANAAATNATTATAADPTTICSAPIPATATAGTT